MKTKLSLALPPDPDSVQQAMLRVHYQTYYWLRFADDRIVAISCEENGWTVDVEQRKIQPVWLTGQ